MSERVHEGPPSEDEATAYYHLLCGWPSLNNSKMPDACRAVNGIHNQDDLWLLRKHQDDDVRMAICRKLSDPDRLRYLTGDSCGQVRDAATRRLKSISPQETIPVPSMSELYNGPFDASSVHSHASSRNKAFISKAIEAAHGDEVQFYLGKCRHNYGCTGCKDLVNDTACPACGAPLNERPPVGLSTNQAITHDCGAILNVNWHSNCVGGVAIINRNYEATTTQEKEDDMKDNQTATGKIEQLTAALVSKNKQIIEQEAERQAGRAALEMALDLPVFKALPEQVQVFLHTPLGKYTAANVLASISVMYDGPHRDKLAIITDSVLRGAVGEVADKLDITRNLNELVSKFSDRFPSKTEA